MAKTNLTKLVNSVPFVSVVIPAYNGEKTIARCIESVLKQDYQGNYEIIVVDNGSNDRTGEVIDTFGSVIKVVYPDIQSPGAARNAGVEVSKGTLIAFTDADMFVAKDWMRKGVQCLRTNEKGIVAGFVNIPTRNQNNLVELYDKLTAFDQKKYTDHGYSGTGNLFVLRDVFDRVGGFKPELKSGEDVEWGKRATGMGYTIQYCPDVIAYHPARSSFRDLLMKQFRVGYGAGQKLTSRKTNPLTVFMVLIREIKQLFFWFARVFWRLACKCRKRMLTWCKLFCLLPIVVVFGIATSLGRVKAILDAQRKR